MNANPSFFTKPASWPRFHAWRTRLLLGLVLLIALALPASAAPPPDVDCGREGRTCPFVGEFKAFAVTTFTLSSGQSAMEKVYLPAIKR